MRPRRRSEKDSERYFGILHDYVAHAKNVPGVRFATARELLQLYGNPSPPRADRKQIAAHLAARQTLLEIPGGALSAADMLLALLGMDPQYVDGPVTRATSTFRNETVPRAGFERAKADAVSFITANRRLPAEIWIGSATLSIGDFAATLAGDEGAISAIAVRRANLECER